MSLMTSTSLVEKSGLKNVKYRVYNAEVHTYGSSRILLWCMAWILSNKSKLRNMIIVKNNPTWKEVCEE
jgi:hypothetical protein